MAVQESGLKLIITESVMCLLATIFICLRGVSALKQKRRPQLHDAFVCFSLLCMIGYLIDMSYGAVHGGFGIDTWNLTDSQMTIALKTFYASEYFFSTFTAANRLSMLALYIQIFHKRPFKIACYVVGSLITAYWVGSILTSLLICRPIRANWEEVEGSHCGNTYSTELASASWNLIADLTLVIMPMPIIWNLQMSKESKMGTTVAFGLGITIAGINIGRIVQTCVSNHADFTVSAVDASILGYAEGTAGVIVATVPLLGPIFTPRKWRGSKNGSRKALQAKQRALEGLDDNSSQGESKSSWKRFFSSQASQPSRQG